MPLNPGDIVNERYQVIQELGRGGFGITYTAYDTLRSPSIVVLKQITITAADNNNESERDNDYITRLEAEARILRELEHSCIPNFFDSFIEDNCYYIVQEYIEGHDLSREILPGEPISELEALTILRNILEILQFVHSKNIIHRDIKPANIIRRHSDGKLFLIDFGAVKEIATEHTNASGITLTRIIHSRGYTPAEQLSGLPRENSDIYALGMMMMQAVTGFSIDVINNPDTVLLRDSQCNYIWQEYAPRISLEVKQIISQMIEYSFGDRYQTADEVLSAINTPEPVSLPEENRQFHSNISTRQRKLIRFMTLVVATCFLLILSKNILFSRPNICANLGDNISCGEEILDPLSKGSIRVKAAEQYNNREYDDSTDDYQLSWQTERRDAESLIYLNNSLLKATKQDYYTIAVAVPLSSDENASIQNSKLAQGFLRGIAQAQTEVNLSLSEKNDSFKLLPGQGILKARNISANSDKGLKVVIVDDGNNREQAKKTAESIAEIPELLGVLGNYASGMTLATVDIYEQNDLTQVSFGTTTKRLTTNPRYNFFRIVYTSDEEAESVVKYIQSINAAEKQVAGFYSPNSPYSNHFWIEVSDRLTKAGIPIYKAFDLADNNFNTKLALKEANNNNVNVYILLPDGQVTDALSNAIEIIQADRGKSFIVGGNTIVTPEVTKLDIPLTTNIAASIFWHPLSRQNPQFIGQSEELWGAKVDKGTAITYDAAISLIEAIRIQKKPTRRGTIAQLSNPEFLLEAGATGNIKFNTPRNGDRKDFYPTLVRLAQCEDKNQFIPLSLDRLQAQELGCYINE